MQRVLAVLDPGTRVPELECFNRIAVRSRVPATYHLPALFGLDSLERLSARSEIAGVVVLGSGASVNEKYLWQDALREWLRPRLLGSVPSLGLCYGHQLFAQMLGGSVDYLFEDRRKLKGLRQISLGPSPLWGDARRGPVVVSHAEAVLEVPPDCDVLARTPVCEVEAIVHRRLPIWSFQSHPEATPAFLANNDIPMDGAESQLSFGHGLVDAFLDRVADDRPRVAG